MLCKILTLAGVVCALSACTTVEVRQPGQGGRIDSSDGSGGSGGNNTTTTDSSTDQGSGGSVLMTTSSSVGSGGSGGSVWLAPRGTRCDGFDPEQNSVDPEHCPADSACIGEPTIPMVEHFCGCIGAGYISCFGAQDSDEQGCDSLCCNRFTTMNHRNPDGTLTITCQ